MAEPAPTRQRLVPRLVWPLAISSAILLTLGTSGAWYVLQLQRSASQILDWNVTSIRAAEELEIGVRELRSLLREYLLSNDSSPLDLIPQQLEVVSQWLNESARLATSEREHRLMREALTGYAELQRECQNMAQAQGPTERQLIVRYITDVIIPQRILPQANEYLSVNEQSLLKNNRDNQLLAQRLSLALLLIGISGASGGLMAGYVLARTVNRSFVQLNLPIHDVTGQLQEVVGPVPVPIVANFQDLEVILRQVSGQVTEVVQRLRQRETQALRAEQLAALGQLAAGLAHELRNPLTSMKILVQSALSQERGQLDGADLDVLDDEITRLEQLLQTFLDFARPPEPAKRETSLTELVRHTVELMSRQAQSRGVTLHFEPSTQEITLAADAPQLRQVLLNLLLNAIDAANGQGHVEVELHQRPQSGSPPSEVLIVVRDDGEGLPAQNREHLFEPFFSTKSTGIGLGLAICQRIVEAHGGRISAREGVPRGAVFDVVLPCPAPPLPGPVMSATVRR